MATKTTKTDAVLKLLGRQQGATVAQLQKATGWQPHSVRAALSGLRQEGSRHPAGEERKGRHRLQDRRTMNRHADGDRIAGELSATPGLTRGELIGLWEKAHGRPPPKGLSRRLLEYSAAYQVQARAFGGLKPMVRRKLRARAASRRENVQIDTSPMPVQGPLARNAPRPRMARRAPYGRGA